MTILIAYKMEDLFTIVNQTYDLTGAFSALTIKPNTNFNLIKKIAFVEEVAFLLCRFLRKFEIEYLHKVFKS